MESREAFQDAASVLHHLLDVVLPNEPRAEVMINTRALSGQNATDTPAAQEPVQEHDGVFVTPAECDDDPQSVLFVRGVLNVHFSPNTTFYLVINRIVATVTFNLAQTLRGESEMVYAIVLYESAYSLAIKDEPIACLSLEMIALSALNNATHTRHQYGNFEAARDCADCLIYLVHSLPMPSSNLEFRARIMLNAIALKEPSIVARAA